MWFAKPNNTHFFLNIRQKTALKPHSTYFLLLHVAGRSMCYVVWVWKKYVLCGLSVEEVCAMWFEMEMPKTARGRSMCYVV